MHRGLSPSPLSSVEQALRQSGHGHSYLQTPHPGSSGLSLGGLLLWILGMTKQITRVQTPVPPETQPLGGTELFLSSFARELAHENDFCSLGF